MYPIAFHAGPLTIHWFGVMMALAFLAGLWTAARRAPAAGIAGEQIVDLGPWLIGSAVVGARVHYVITYWHEGFAGQPWTEVFMIQRGGLVFYGGLLAASLACILYSRARGLALWKVADVLTPSLALGYVFGRIGCLLNGCCYGRVCDLPWAIRFPNKSFAWENHFAAGRVGGTEPSAPVHPTQIYDSLLNLGFYLALAWLFRRRRFDGQVFASYLMGYAVVRSSVELFRGDYSAAHLHSGLTPAHLVSIGIFMAGLLLFFILRHRAPQPGQTTER